MRPRALADVSARLGGTLEGDGSVEVGGATADSREVRSGQLFVAIRGARADGHDFAADAFASGAAAALVSRRIEPSPWILVPDTVEGLLALASDERASMTAQVVGITGSTGKTSVKDLAAAVAAVRFRVAASERSFNTEVGVPITMLNADPRADVLVLEMGSRGAGHVARLCSVARPTIGVVTSVGPAHLEMFGSLEAVANAKAELVEALPRGGTAVLNADDPIVRSFAARTSARVLRYGLDPLADVGADELSLDELGRASFVLRTPEGKERVELAVSGEHMAVNALAAAAVGLSLGISPAECAAGLREARVSPWRMEITDGERGIRVVNDAYNANPVSMAAALKTLRWMARDGRSIAVLGPMAELGEGSAEHHERIGELSARLRIDHLVVVGDRAQMIAAGAIREGVEPDRVTVCAGPDEALALVRGMARPGDVVLVKGSRVAGLERVAEGLR